MQEVQCSSVMSKEGLGCPLVQTRVQAKASSGVVRVELRQRFFNPHEAPLDAEFRLSLPADAAVSGFSFEVGDKKVVGALRPLEDGAPEFETAQKQGKSAAALSRIQPSILRQLVTNIPPGQPFEVQIRFEQSLRWLREGRWEWRFPTKVTSCSEESAESSRTEAPFQVELRLDAHRLTGAPESPSHKIKTRRTLRALWVELPESGPWDRDVVVRWPVEAPQVGLHLELEPAFEEDGAFGQLTIVSPKHQGVRPPQTFWILLDTSSSMAGAPLLQAKRLIGMLIQQLRPEDKLQLVAFSGHLRRMLSKPQSVSPALQELAQDWLIGREAEGRANLARALYLGLDPKKEEDPSGPVKHQVILVSDGWNHHDTALEREIQNSLLENARLHVVGVSNSPNRGFTQPAAHLGRGVEVLLGDTEDVERALERLLPRLRPPIVTDLKVFGSRPVMPATRRLPDLYPGEVVTIGLFVFAGCGDIRVHGRFGEGRYKRKLRLPSFSALSQTGLRGLKQCYGQALVEGLQIKCALAEASQNHALTAELRSCIDSVSDRFQILSRFNAWFTVGNRVPVSEKKGESLAEKTRRALQTLTPRENRVIRMRFGLGEGSEPSLKEVGQDFDVTRERIRSIEAKALAKLRHPSRARLLRSFIEDEGEQGNPLRRPRDDPKTQRKRVKKVLNEQWPSESVRPLFDESLPEPVLRDVQSMPGWPKQLVDVRGGRPRSVRSDHDITAKQLLEARRCGCCGLRRIDDAKELLTARRGAVCYPAPKRRTPVDRRNPDKEAPNTAMKKTIQIGDTITVAELSQQMSQKAPKLIGWLMKNGVMATINQPIEHETAVMLCAEFGFEVESKVFQEEEMLAGASLQEAQASHDDNSEPRAPVVTVMGHVDHGKTSLLDRIRNTKLAAAEAGGITQRIAGYQVKTKEGLITFMDTPGHGAFVTMRARGANVTDIVVLVVAADDGVKPQTLEAIKLAKSASVPIVVALNKIDKSDANPDRVLKQLADASVLVEAWGGDVPCQYISAKTGDGVDELLELLVLQAEVLELKADSKLPAVGTVIEGYVHKGRGPVASVLIREGSLKAGEVVVVGEKVGKVRALTNDAGKKVKVAGPSSPVELLGLDGVPSPGDELRVAASLEKARELAAHRRERRRAGELATKTKASLEDLLNRSAPTQKELKIVVKADQQGTAEAVREQLSQLSNKAAKVQVLSAGVGAVVESDVDLAKTSDAFIVGFSVKPDAKAIESARTQAIEIICHKVIYEIVDAVQAKLTELLPKVQRKKVLGQAEVLKVFRVPKIGSIAGCAIREGVVNRSSQIILRRNGDQLFEGRLASLKREKNDVTTVRAGMECGLGLMDFSDIEEGDVLEAFEFEEVSASE